MSGGTSLQELMAMSPQYNAMQNTHYEQGHGAQDMMHQSQHAPYYASAGAQDYPQFIQPVTEPPHEIKRLANDISNNLPDDILSETVAETSSMTSVVSSSLRKLKLPMIILVAYILLSLPTVQQTLGRVLVGVNANLVIVIYGVILAALVMLGKRLVRRF